MMSILFTTVLSLGMLMTATSATSSAVHLNTASAYRQYSSNFVGGTYVMTNDFDQNSILAYARRPNGTLSFLGSFKTGGKGAELGNNDGVDPLVSAYSVVLTPDYRFLLAVNAGSNSVSVFKVLPDFKLHLSSIQRVAGMGPVSIAYSQNIVYVASADADGKFEGGNDQKGVLSGFKLTKFGYLVPIHKSVRVLTARPATIQFSPDGHALLVSFVNAGAAELNTTKVDEIAAFAVNSSGRLSRSPVDTASSTMLNNKERRNLPTAIGFETVKVRGAQYVIVTEARVIGPDGKSAPIQTPSISTWRLTGTHKLKPVQLDVLVGKSITRGQRATCWIEFSKSAANFWVANTGSGSVSSFSFNSGISELSREVEATLPAPIDLWRSKDGKFLYQLYNGHIAVFEIGSGGRTGILTKIQTVDNLPDRNVQGIVAF